MKPQAPQRLADAYTFLRRVEHRIQYLDDQQTHLLPTVGRRPGLDRAQPGPDLRRQGQRLRTARPAGRNPRIGGHRVRRPAARRPVARATEPRPQPAAHAAPARRCRSTARRCSTACPPNWPSRMRRWVQHPRVAALRDESKLRLGRLVRRAADCLAEGDCSLAAALRFIDWLEPLLRRESYLALLVERPEVQQRLLRLLGMARWPMRYLMRHPGVIDELADERLLQGPLRPRCVPRRTAGAARGLGTLRPGRRRIPARHPAPCAPCRGLPHAGARRRARADGRRSGRRPVGAGRRRARRHACAGPGRC